MCTPQLGATAQRRREPPPLAAGSVLCEPDHLPPSAGEGLFRPLGCQESSSPTCRCVCAGVLGGAVEGGVGVRQRINPVAPTEDTAPATDSAERRMGTAVGRSDVWFRFKEGVSNAVRRSLHVRELL